MPNLLTRLFLRERGSKDVGDNFPYRQLLVLACRICEPIAFMSIFPYAYRMIETFNITQDESQISVYAGMLITAFAFAEFSTGMIWGRVSDRVGRKPVLLMGLLGTALSMLSFGFARTLPAAIMARSLGGLLNGNVGVLQTTVAELVTKKEHQPRAYSIMPLVWSIGSIIGPAIGGALAMPCESLGFSRGGWFDTYPFLLPNLICVIILVFGISVGFLFLEETHVDKKGRWDPGLELGKIILSWFSSPRAFCQTDKAAFAHDTAACQGFLETDPPPGYRSTESSPLLRSTTTATLDSEMLREKENRGVVKTFNKQVILIIVAYAILAYHSVSFDALMPTFLSEERMQTPPVLPFKFAGGFALSTQAIGFMMAVQGAYSMFAQFCLFPLIVRRAGTLRASRVVLSIWPLLYLAVPYLILLPEHLQKPGIYASLIIKITFQAISFPSNAILLANAAHSKTVLGSINGVAASSACLARALGPVVTGSIHSAGLKFGCGGLAWWAGGLVCAAGALESFWMEESEGRLDRPSNEGEESQTCEPLLHPTAVEATAEDGCTPRSPLPPDSLALMDDLDLTDTKLIKYEIDFASKE